MTTIILEFLKIALVFLKKYWYYVALVICGLTIYLLCSTIKSKNKEIVRQSSNIEVLNTDFKSYKVSVKVVVNGKDSLIKLSVGRVGTLTYTVDELKKYNTSATQMIENLKLKLKNVQSTTNITTQTDQNIHTPTILKDSTMCFDFSDTYLRLSGCSSKKGTDIKYHSTDSIFTVIDMVSKHNFLFFHWGDKITGLTAVSKNPNTDITGLKYTIVKH